MEDFCPIDQKEWREWLRVIHAKKDSVWVIFYKKKSPHFNLSWSESVDEALCFGWIDSTKRSIDEERFKQYFTRRKPKSNWSKINKDKVKALAEKGLMQEAGLKSIEVAKENGSWTLLDAIEALEVPEDLQVALEKDAKATAFFEGLSNSGKKILLHWVISAKRDETRQKRITEIAQNASAGLKPKQFR